jgi:hypothetical protein
MSLLLFNESRNNFVSMPMSLTEEKIISFLRLEEGWHYGEGIRPSQDNLKNALQILYALQTYGLRSDAFPGVNGEIQVVAYNADETLEITIEADGRITYILERADEELEYAEDLSTHDAVIRVNSYGRGLCNLSELSIQTITTNAENDLPALHSGIRPTKAEFQLFRSSV